MDDVKSEGGHLKLAVAAGIGCPVAWEEGIVDLRHVTPAESGVQ